VEAISSTSGNKLAEFQISVSSPKKELSLKLLFSLSSRLSKLFRSKKLGRVSLARVFAGAFGWSAFVSAIFTILHKYDLISLLSSIVASSGLILAINSVVSSSCALLCNLTILFAIAVITLIVLTGIVLVGILLLGLSE